MTTRYYNVEREDGSRIITAATVETVSEYMEYETMTDGGSRVFLRRCGKTGKPQRGAKLWYFELNLDMRTPESEQADCYWSKWPFLEVSTPDWESGREIERSIQQTMERLGFGSREFYPTWHRHSTKRSA